MAIGGSVLLASPSRVMHLLLNAREFKLLADKLDSNFDCPFSTFLEVHTVRVFQLESEAFVCGIAALDCTMTAIRQ
jgi:hypothetical protein